MADTKLNFGKYKDKTIGAVYDMDRDYCRWLFKQIENIDDANDGLSDFLKEKFHDDDGSYLLKWGKNKGKTIKWIQTNQPKYFEWLKKSDYIKDKVPNLYKQIQELSS